MTTPLAAPETVVLDVGGLRFNAIAAGPQGGTPAILLHGFPEFADAWLPILQTLGTRGFRAVAFDQRGYSPGARPAAIEDYATDTLVADVLSVADAIGATRFHLIGHDWGGAVAWRLAARHGERLLSLAVLSTPHNDALLDAKATDPDQHQRSAYIDFFRQPGQIAEHALLADGAKRLRNAYQGLLTDGQVQSYVERLGEPGALTAAINWYRAMDQDPLGPIKVPTLYAWGSEDQALGHVAAMATANYVQADYTFAVLYGKSHWLLEQAPQQVASLLSNHLQQCQLGDSAQ